MKKLFTLLALSLLSACASLPEDFEQIPGEAWPHPYDTKMGAFFEQMAPADKTLSGVRLLADPKQAFRARYGFAAQAEHTLDLQYYLWKGDITGGLLLYRAIQAADRGVKVRILIDDIYHSGRDHVYAEIDAHPNIQVRVFNPMGNRGIGRQPNYLVNKGKLNHRMHNKIFLVDNAVAILGGRNIGDDYFGIDPKLNFEDLDVLAVGPVAQEAGRAYDLYWNSPAAVPVDVLFEEPVDITDMDVLRTELEEGLQEAIGSIPYQVPASWEEIETHLEALAADLVWARSEIVVDPLDRFDGDTESAFVALGRELSAGMENDIVIQTAYLIPTEEGIENIRKLTDRGIRVRAMTNSLMSNNHISVHAHYMKHRKALIRAGVELYELRADNELLEHYKETDSRIADSHAGLHTKAFVVDGRISMIGSYNMDPRSRIWNSEIGLLVHSQEFGQIVLDEMNEEFESANAYRLYLNEKDKVRWSIENDQSTRVWKHDPDSPFWRRMLARMIRLIPIENEL
jgi:putative cardiolipin synthase